MFFTVSVLFWFLLAIVFACIEIEAEGEYGWAKKMPTWYRTTGFWARLYGLLMSKKPLTGYHTFMFFLPLMIFHCPFFAGKAWTWQEELMTLALYFAWCPVWDFLWFVLNPEYGLKNFKKDKVWWHSKSIWLFGLFPADYLIGWVVSAILAGVGGRLLEHLNMLLVFSFFVGVTVFLSPFYHKWYKRMRTKDDRDKAGIFDLPEPPKPKPMSADDFDWFGGFYEGLAVVHEDGDAYHVREDFTPAYSERYSAATHFKNGIAEVVTHANWVIRIRPDGTSIDHV